VNVSLRTQACVLLGCEHPVVLAGMGGVGRSELVAAVTQAGGFGFLGMVREPPSLIRREVEAVRRVTSKPFGANLIPAATDGDLLEQQLVTCIELGVPVVALFWDLSREVVRRLCDAGILVVCRTFDLGRARTMDHCLRRRAAQEAGTRNVGYGSVADVTARHRVRPLRATNGHRVPGLSGEAGLLPPFPGLTRWDALLATCDWLRPDRGGV
jgi:hypothetical protein